VGKFDLRLCEDKEGDCASLGYTPLQTWPAETAKKIQPNATKPSPEASSTVPSHAKSSEPEHVIIDLGAHAHSPPARSNGTKSAKSAPLEPAMNNSADKAPTSEPVAMNAPADNDSTSSGVAALFFCFLFVGGAAFGLGWLLEARH